MRNGQKRHSSQRTEETDDLQPKAHVLKFEPTSKGAFQAWVACPLCGDVHTHGVSKELHEAGGNLGHCVAHCKGVEAGELGGDVRDGGYYLWAFGPSGMTPFTGE